MEGTEAKAGGIFLGAGLIGLLLGGLVAAVVGWVVVENARHEARIGWKLVPVVTLKQDVPESTVLDLDMLMQTPIPEQFVTDSVVRPHDVNYVIGQTVAVPLLRGEPLRWVDFESTRQARSEGE